MKRTLETVVIRSGGGVVIIIPDEPEELARRQAADNAELVLELQAIGAKIPRRLRWYLP